MSSQERTTTTLFIGGLSPKIPLKEYEEFFATFLAKFELRLSGKTEGRVSNGYGYLETSNKATNVLLSKRELQYKETTIVCMPYLSGDELKQHHQKLNSRRIIVRSSFPIDQRELELAFQNYGRIESAYLRSEPKKIQRHLAVVIYYTTEAAERAKLAYEAYELHPKYSVHSSFKTMDNHPVNQLKNNAPVQKSRPPKLLQNLNVTPGHKQNNNTLNRLLEFHWKRNSQNGNTNDKEVKPQPYKLSRSRKIVKRSLHFIPSNHNPMNIMFNQPDSYNF